MLRRISEVRNRERHVETVEPLSLSHLCARDEGRGKEYKLFPELTGRTICSIMQPVRVMCYQRYKLKDKGQLSEQTSP